ncbi:MULTISPECIES: hypothetical protein [unclassified Microcoleus]|uniref:hypothetical protein n=1 Tax=unclassified Microcoleus TaxID=2642155 RepID=UPI002FD268CE
MATIINVSILPLTLLPSRLVLAPKITLPSNAIIPSGMNIGAVWCTRWQEVAMTAAVSVLIL